MTNQARTIARDMRSLCTALKQLTRDDRLSEDIAFHLAEIRSELDDLKDVIDSCVSSSEMSVAHIKRITYILGTHWPYHIKLLGKSLKANAITKYANDASPATRQGQRVAGISNQKEKGIRRLPDLISPSEAKKLLKKARRPKCS